MKRLVFFCTFIIGLAIHARAQSIVFSAEASANTMGIQDVIQVSFSLDNAQLIKELNYPQFSDFKVVGGPSSSRGSKIYSDGRQTIVSETYTISYYIQPLKLGELTIKPIAAKDAEGRVYYSNALKINVVKGSLAEEQRRQQQANNPLDDFWGGGANDPMEEFIRQQQRMEQMMQQIMQQAQQQQQQGQGMQSAQNLPKVGEKELGKNLFVKVNVDKTKVNIGEQITVTYKVYTRFAMQAQISKLPSLNGFWTQDFELPKDQKPQTEYINGVAYKTFTLKKSALFPQQTGTLILDPAEIVGVAQIQDRANPWGRDVQFALKSTPISVSVSPLPLKDQPENFSGAVGTFTLKDSIDKTTLSTDETVNLSLDIAGSGNLKLIEAPKLNLPKGLDAFEPTIIDTITSRSTIISGHKIFTYSIAPRVVGEYEIPSISFAYYDSKTNTYKTLHTKPYKIKVSQGTGAAYDANKKTTLSDIHPIISKPFASTKNKIYFFSWGYWSLFLIPLLALVLFILFKKKNEQEQNNISLFKNKYAVKVALKRLKTAKSYLDKQQSGLFYEEISKAIWLYLSDKLNIPLAQLSKENALESLVAKNVPQNLMDKIELIIEDCSSSLYAPGGGKMQMKNIYNDTVLLIGELEMLLKK